AGGAVWVGMVLIGKLTVPLFFDDTTTTPSIDVWLGLSIWNRVDIYEGTLRLILERPWLGGGANMFMPLFEPHVPEMFGNSSFFFAHNDYLQVWLEYGLPGLILLLALAACALGVSRAAARRDPGNPLPAACGAALASYFAHAA